MYENDKKTVSDDEDENLFSIVKEKMLTLCDEHSESEEYRRFKEKLNSANSFEDLGGE